MVNTAKHFLATLSICLISQYTWAASYKPIVLDPSYNHTKYSPECTGFEKQFRAYTSCFDTKSDDGQAWRIPKFISYQMKKYQGKLPKGPKRPRPWITEKPLRQTDEVATDKAYTYSNQFRKNHKDWYVRGHLAMKQHAWRMGENADWNTHTMLNAVPQRQTFNAGIWLDLEYRTADWADEFGEVWVIAGPVFLTGRPTAWIGEPSKGESLVAVPDALFKIVVLPAGVLAFIYPQQHIDYGDKDHASFKTTIARIDVLTGLNFPIDQ